MNSEAIKTIKRLGANVFRTDNEPLGKGWKVIP